MSYIKPQITPPSPLIFAILNGGSKRRTNSADLGSPHGKPTENTGHLTWRVGGERLGEVWFGSSSTAYSFLMISPNLHDIWAMFFLILSRYEKLVLLTLQDFRWWLFSVGQQKSFLLCYRIWHHPRLYATAVISQHLDLTLLYADWTVVK